MVGRVAGLFCVNTRVLKWPTQDDVGEGEAGAESDTLPFSAAPLPEWVPWLRTIITSIREHINPPTALGSGHRALADKAAAEVYKWALQEPMGAPLASHASSYVSHTSDMGVELGLPEFTIPDDGIERLLPGWMHRAGLQPEPLDVGDLEQVWQLGKARVLLG